MAENGDSAGDWRIALELLRRLGCAAIVADGENRIVAWNRLAAHWVSAWSSVLPPEIRNGDGNPAAVETVQWIARKRGDPVILQTIEAPSGSDSRHAILLLIDPRRSLQIDEEVLRKLYRLTPAEVKLAVSFARGKRMRAIAAAHDVSMGTVRTQLSSIFAKTHTQSQVELGLLLARLAIIQMTNR